LPLYGLQPGELTEDEFLNLAASGDVIILDVRSREEASKGMIRGAINIPHNELEKRHTELPKDKKIIIYCSEGFRAEYAYGLLKNYLGFEDVWFTKKFGTLPNFSPTN
jgi:rhodanese-related sulfurtransferase